ncbi:MAG: helix-turn-helix domain-containing protein [Sphingobacteriales bacterium]|nr:MAG: helix-turn-helix domain-containing protein [Sphingobacteriales bacterium]
MKKVKNTIPVYDICALERSNSSTNSQIIAEPFAEYLKAHPNLHLAHRHSFYHIVLFTKGGGFHTIDFERFDVTAGQIYFMIPGQVHSWNFEGETDGFVINFSEHLFEHFLVSNEYLEAFSFFQGIAADGVVQLQPKALAEAQEIIQNIVRDMEQPDAYTNDYVRASLIALFISVSRQASRTIAPTAKPHNQLLLVNFRKLVDKYYSDKRLPKDYAALLYITPNHLNALCQDMIGKSAGEVIRDRILLEAKRLLINADMNISQIAAKLEFTDNSHFSKFFKKYTNSTPEEFRRKATTNI